MGNEGSQPVKYANALQNDVSLNWNEIKSGDFIGREGHCTSAYGNKLFSYGGVSIIDTLHDLNQLIVFDLEKDDWEILETKGEKPSSRAGACFEAVNGKIYLFGGLNHQEGWVDAVHCYDTETRTWSVLQTTGTAPSPRDKSCSCVINDTIYIFGGFGPQGTEEDDEDEDEEETVDDIGAQFGWFNDLFIFDTVTNSWSKPLQMNMGAPSPRAAAGMVAIDEHLIIFGGKDAEARKNDLYIFNTVSRKWAQGLEQVVTGRQPEPRSFHALTAVGKRVVVTGGRGTDNQHFNDIHIFDTETKEWLQPTVTGSIPTARGAHTATVVKDRLVIFGGSADFIEETGCCETFLKDCFFIPTADVLTGKAFPNNDSEDKENSVNTSNKPPMDTQSKGENVNSGTPQDATVA